MYKRQVYYRENSRMVRPDLNATAEARVKGLVGLRDCVQQLSLIHILSRNCSRAKSICATCP